MANVNVTGVDLTTGQFRRAVAGDFPTDTSGNLLSDLLSDRKLSTTSSIDLKTVATTNLYTVPAGKTAVITKAIVRITAATTITVPATAGIGIAAGEDDIFTSQLMTDVDTAGDEWIFVVLGKNRTAPAASVIKLGVDVGATGATLTASVDLFGYFAEDPSAGSGISIPGPYSASVYKSSTQSLATSSLVTVTYDAELFDNGGFHDNVTNNSRLTAPATGRYLVSTLVRIDGSTAGDRLTALYINGSFAYYGHSVTGTRAGGQWSSTNSWLVSLSAGDYVELVVFQSSGSSLTIQNAPDNSLFSIVFIPGQ